MPRNCSCLDGLGLPVEDDFLVNKHECAERASPHVCQSCVVVDSRCAVLPDRRLRQVYLEVEHRKLRARKRSTFDLPAKRHLTLAVFKVSP